jgi:hypothetical protein
MSNDAFKKEQGVKKTKKFMLLRKRKVLKKIIFIFIFIYYTHFILVAVMYLK